jgi:16S rRNA (cytidine1402-2'-O)-methyltransferase
VTASAGRLSIVATPIGNLEDITLRALRVLREADLVLAEDTRRTRVLLQQHGLRKKLWSYHAHSGPRETEKVLEELAAGRSVALVTDAGTPLVSDPGAELVREAAARGLVVESVPGASAVLAALTVCGIAADSFRFVGFLPRSGKRRREALAELARDRAATVLFESPQRLAASLKDFAAVLPPERQVAVCRELTKVHEEVVRGSAAELAERFAEGARGEITVVVSGAAKHEELEAETEEGLEAKITAMLAEGRTPRDVVKELQASTALSKSDLYARVLELRGDREESEEPGA